MTKYNRKTSTTSQFSDCSVLNETELLQTILKLLIKPTDINEQAGDAIHYLCSTSKTFSKQLGQV